MSQRYAPASVIVGEEVFETGNRFSINLFRLGYPITTGVLIAQDVDIVDLSIESGEIENSGIVEGQDIYLGYGCSTQRMLFQIAARVSRIINNHLTISILGKPEKCPRRKFVRADLGWVFRVGREHIVEQLLSCNVSGGGVLLQTASPWHIDVGELVDCSVEHTNMGSVKLKARVVRYEESGQRVALCFQELDDKTAMRIQLDALRAVGRRFLRAIVEAPVVLRVNDSAFSGSTVNISGNGALVSLKDPLILDVDDREPFELDFHINGELLLVRRAKIVRRKNNEEIYEIAFSFADVSRSIRMKIVEFVMGKIRHV